ncbi:hypothetical protein GCM10022200_04710 [Microbacterium awajiense]|uniref:Uncharacterized protein n=1 Tax=Microbacterium awajiense TaxID=415214 RepID=A0ABP7A5N3_9MICO
MTDAPDPLRAPVTALRRVTAGRDGPWDGTLVRLGERGGVLVDIVELGADWPGSSAREDGHLVAALDVVRRHDGHDALLPALRDRLRDALARRGGGAGLSDGEAVTVGVSALRAVAELAAIGVEPSGEWWVTADGRPVLALGVGTASARAATIELLNDMAAAPTRRDWTDLAGAIAEPATPQRVLLRGEETLFATAAPAPLATEGIAPRPARSLRVADDGSSVEPERPGAPWFTALARHVDADLADTVSEVATDLWRRARTPRRRRPWLVAALIGGAVVAGGLLWPAGPGSPATAEPAGIDSAPAAPIDPDGTGTPDPPVDQTPAGLDSVASQLLEARTACGGTSACLSELMQDPTSAVPAGPVDLPADERTVTVLDDLGGVAVLRVDGPDGRSQLVVIAESGGRWLLRDVHDVAQQR